MRKRKGLLALIFAIVAVFGVASPASASTESTGNVLEISSPPGYCAYEGSLITLSSTGVVTSDASAEVNTGANPCDWQSSIANLPNDYVEVRLSIRCLSSAGGSEWVGYDSGFHANPAGFAGVYVSPASSKYCGNTSGSTYPHARAVVTGKFYVYPTGWRSFLETTHWAVSL